MERGAPGAKGTGGGTPLSGGVDPLATMGGAELPKSGSVGGTGLTPSMMREALEELLAPKSEAQGLDAGGATLDSKGVSPHPFGARLGDSALSSAPELDAGAGVGTPTKIGRYEIVRLLGEGGFGSVYLAEQRVPVRRKVALKVVKLGMDTSEVLQRFEAERQALAMMDHPNVARVYDAGMTERGQPFFAMEFVEGVPLNQYVDENEMGVRARCELFMEVCRAVQHAHGKGLIHRDLKPGNIIVSTVDGKASPKVIDFGIAKATSGGSLTDTQFRTETGRLIGTPEYMSPEQCEGSADIDTRTDVYALGVILYELLTGQLPFDSKELRAGGIDGITKIIREREAPRPSAKVTRLDLKSDSAVIEKITKSRHADLRHLQRAISGDLDWIVLRALEKDRNQRYDTANALLMDVQRHLNNEPVSAGPPSRRYRFEKFARRNRGLLAGLAGVAAALVVGLVLASVGFVQASNARDRAMVALQQEKAARERERLAEVDRAATGAALAVEAERAKAVAGFMQNLFAAIDPTQAKGRDVTVREVFAAATRELDAGKLAGQPEAEATLRNTIGNTLRNLGDSPAAVGQLERAVKLVEGGSTVDKALLLQLKTRLGLAYRDAKQTELAMRTLEGALAMAVETRGADAVETGLAAQSLALVHQDVGRLEDAERYYRRALAVFEKTLGTADARTAIVRNNLGALQHARGSFSAAEATYREALSVLEKQYGSEAPAVASARRNLGLVLYDKGDLGGAEKQLGEAVTIWKRVLPPTHPDYRQALDFYGDALRDQGKLEAAEGVVRESLGIRESVSGKDSSDAMLALSNLANLYQRQEKWKAALSLSRELLERAKRREAVRTLSVGKKEDAIELAGYLAMHATLLLETGAAAEAEGFARRALELREKFLAMGDWRRANTVSLVGACMVAQGKYKEAEPLLFESFQTMSNERSTPKVTLERAKARMVKLYEGLGRMDEAGKYR